MKSPSFFNRLIPAGSRLEKKALFMALCGGKKGSDAEAMVVSDAHHARLGCRQLGWLGMADWANHRPNAERLSK
jgi:hypothetical protein